MSINGKGSLYPNKPPVFLEAHPLRGLSQPVFSSTPDLANTGANGSSDSLNSQHDFRLHHGSHESVYKGHEAVHPSMNPLSTRYEWSDTFVDTKVKRNGEVSEGYCKLRIFEEPSANKASTLPAGDYSVLNIGSIENSDDELEAAGDDHSQTVDEAVKNHHYFTLEVLDDSSCREGNTRMSSSSGESLEEEEGLYFSQGEVVEPNGHSYVELDTDERGLSPPVLVKTKHKNDVSSERTFNRSSRVEKDDCTYDILRRDVTPPQLPPKRQLSKLSHKRTPSPKSPLEYCRASTEPRISPPCVPYHKRDFQRNHSESSSPRFKYPDYGTKRTVKTHSPKVPPAAALVSHNYDEVEFDEGRTSDINDTLTDDDIPVTLSSPVSPFTPVTPLSPPLSKPPERQSSHSNLVQLIITDEGPLLLETARKRSLTADANFLKQLRNQQKFTSNNSTRAASAMDSK